MLVLTVTVAVLTLTVTLVEPAGMVMAESVTSVGLLAMTVTFTPPDGAGPFSVTVSAVDVPPTKLVGLKLSVDSVAALMVSVADLVTVP
jgi:hypothetical protein